MEDALWKSCNTYFAGLAEQRFTGEQMREVYHMFGFDRPTGVRWRSEDGRIGIVDNFGGGTEFFQREGSEARAHRAAVPRERPQEHQLQPRPGRARLRRARDRVPPSMTLVREASGEESA